MGMHGRRAHKTSVRITSIALSALLTAGSILSAPALASAITTETEAELTETQKQVEETAAAYDEATENLEELEEEIAEIEDQIADLEAELPEAQEAASDAMVDLYLYDKNTNSFLTCLLNSESFDEVITTAKYMEQIQEENNAAVDELNELQAELEEQEAALEAAKAEAEEEQAAAEEALEEAQELREEAQAKAEEEQAAEEEAAALAAAEAEAEAEAEEEAETETEEESSSSSGSSSSSSSSSTSSSSSSSSTTTTTVSSSEVNWDVSKEEFVAEWGARIDAYLSGSALAGYGDVFAEAAWTYGVDPRWSPAIACVESSKGANCFKSHNAWGWGSSSWDTWEEAIYAHVSGLARVYGYTLTVSAAKTYCPPNWYNWYNKVAAEMNKI